MIYEQTLRVSMRDLSGHFKLPEAAIGDVEPDVQLMKHHPNGTNFLWVLASNRTYLVPLRLGADPALIIQAVSSGDVKCFYVGSSIGDVHRVSGDNAIKLVQALPFYPCAFSNKEDVQKQVEQILVTGYELRLWSRDSMQDAIKTTVDSWASWRAFFLAHENHLMADFMQRAISCVIPSASIH